MSKSLIQAAKGAVSHFQSDISSRLERIAVKVTLECVLVVFFLRRPLGKGDCD